MATEQMKQSMSEAEKVLYKAYNRYQVMFERGDGVRLYDTDGTEYLDFFAGIAVNALGYHYPGYDEALKAQIDKFQHTSNYFYNPPALSAGEKLLKASQMDKVFFTNSGTEAVEGALKIARRYAYNKNGDSSQYEIIAMDHSFHGRSMGALSVTGKEAYRAPFEPLIPGIRFATFNDLDSVKAQITDKTCGIIVEPIQGEGGIYPASEEFIKGIRALCDEKDILLILDEIQCGMGRTGKVFAFEHAGIVPDVILISKAIGGTQPLAVVVYDKDLDTWGPGAHAGTFRGNQLAMVAGTVVLKKLQDPAFLADVARKGKILEEGLLKLKDEVSIIGDVRGKGLMLGIEFIDPNGPKDIMGHPVPGGDVALKVQRRCLENGLIMEKGGRNGSVMRCLCALNITDDEIKTALSIFEKSVKEVDADVCH